MALIDPDTGAYNRAAIMALARANLTRRAALAAPARGRSPHWGLALQDAWHRAYAERTRYDFAHRRNLTEVSPWASRELSSDGRLS